MRFFCHLYSHFFSVNAETEDAWMTPNKKIERIKTDEKINDIPDNVEILQNFIVMNYWSIFDKIRNNNVKYDL